MIHIKIPVTQHYGAMHDFGAVHAFMVTTGPVTGPARAWAQGKPITIIDGRQLAQWAGATPPAPAPTAPAPDHGTCPKCGAALVVKHNRRTGEPFLACPGYPRCRYTRPLPQ